MRTQRLLPAKTQANTLIWLLMSSFLTAVPIWGQITTGTIAGTIVDDTGAIVPGVSVELTSLETGQIWTGKTSETGEYRFAFLQPGEYSVKAVLSGFQPVRRSQLPVRVNEIVRVDLKLTPSPLEQVIDVAGAPPPLQTESGEIGDFVEHQTIVNLPLNGRNFIQLVALQPGAVSTAKLPGGGLSFASSIFGGNYSVHGAPAEGTLFLLDGIDMKDVVDTRVGFRMTLDAIQEFKFQAANYSAAFGRASGGIVNIASRAGTNEFHGAAWEYIRDDAFDAKSFFAPRKEELRQHQFGAAIGGPMRKDKSFFLLSYESIRSDRGVTRAVTVPTELQRQGDFSQGAPILNPLDVDPETGQRRPFAGNRIPQNLWSPVSVKALDRLFPRPNRPGTSNNLVDTATQEVNSDQINVRIDQRLRDSDTVFGRYTWVRHDRLWPFVFADLPNFTTVWKSPAQNAVIGEVHTFSSTTVNEFRFGYNRHTQVLEDLEQTVPVNQELGITGLSQRFLGNPNIRISGQAGTGAILNAPNNRSDNQFSLRDNLSHTRGRHTLSTGVSVDWYQMNGGANPNAHGGFNFNGALTAQLTPTGTQAGTGNPVADFLLGFPISSARCCVQGDGFRHWRKIDFGAYVQDDWKVSRKLTLNLGLRWEFFEPGYERRLRFAQPDYSKAPALTLLFAGKDGVPQGIRKNEYNNFAPRVGFGYALDDRTVLRGG
ncbi:MAG: TonB-dependent receptor, partial [Acidobacteria bacterium]|nr:TonB-dependent receptor [Acidobacteriota bacterium]